MARGYSHECNKCGYSVSTSGPSEFYRNNKGERKPYGHPIAISEEAKEAGIYGYSGILYCPTCDQTFNLVLEEYRKPYKKDNGLFSLLSMVIRILWHKFNSHESKNDEKEENTLECPKCCKTKLLLTDKDGIGTVSCPRCKQGELISGLGWIS